MNKIFRLTLAALAMTVLFSRSASAADDKPVYFGLQGSWSEDADFGLGARVGVSLEEHVKNVELVGSFDYFFPQAGDGLAGVDVDLEYMEFNVNAIYKFSLKSSSARPYLGGGLNLARAKGGVGIDLGDYGTIDVEASDTAAGVNVVAGVLFNERFFVEARNSFGGGETFVVSAGIRF